MSTYSRGMPLRTPEAKALQRGANALRKVAYAFAGRPPARARAGAAWHDELKTILTATIADREHEVARLIALAEEMRITSHPNAYAQARTAFAESLRNALRYPLESEPDA